MILLFYVNIILKIMSNHGEFWKKPCMLIEYYIKCKGSKLRTIHFKCEKLVNRLFIGYSNNFGNGNRS